MDDLDKQLLNLLQTGFPLMPAPFGAIGEKLGIGEDEVISRVARLKGEKIIRQISAIFDSAALGYSSSLVAFQVAQERIEEVAGIISAHPGVSHNYQRSHAYNLWFTITAPQGRTPEAEVEQLAARSKPISYRLFPTIRLFKIGVAFDMTGDQASNATVRERQRAEAAPLDDDDIRAVRALQRDLPLVSRPFAALGEQVEMAEDELLARAHKLLRDGAMRRYAAVLRHREAGFKANAMVAWVVPEERIEEIGSRMADHGSVSHCYQRPTYADWPFSIFTMIHGRGPEECEQAVREISEATGITDYILLYSTREFKKARVRYYEHAGNQLADVDN